MPNATRNLIFRIIYISFRISLKLGEQGWTVLRKTVNLKAGIVIWSLGSASQFLIWFVLSSQMQQDCEVSWGYAMHHSALLRMLVRGKLRATLTLLGKGDPLVSHHVIAFQSWMMNLQVNIGKLRENRIILHYILFSYVFLCPLTYFRKY